MYLLLKQKIDAPLLRNNLLESFHRSNYPLIIIQLAVNFNRYIIMLDSIKRIFDHQYIKSYSNAF